MTTEWKWRSDNFLITHELAAELKQQLVALGEGRWTNVYGEIQGGGRRIYLSIDLLRDEPEGVLDGCKHMIMRTIGPRLPAKIDDSWSWPVGIRRNGQGIDCVDAISFMYDQA